VLFRIFRWISCVNGLITILKANVLWYVTLCSLVKVRIFGKGCCLYAEGRGVSRTRSVQWGYTESRVGSLERSNRNKNRRTEAGAPLKGILARIWRSGRVTLVHYTFTKLNDAVFHKKVTVTFVRISYLKCLYYWWLVPTRMDLYWKNQWITSIWNILYSILIESVSEARRTETWWSGLRSLI
jgi:hypothetical protein